MIRNYLKIAWRNLTKYKFISSSDLQPVKAAITNPVKKLRTE
jgi:hypothetical protein